MITMLASPLECSTTSLIPAAAPTAATVLFTPSSDKNIGMAPGVCPGGAISTQLAFGTTGSLKPAVSEIVFPPGALLLLSSSSKTMNHPIVNAAVYAALISESSA